MPGSSFAVVLDTTAPLLTWRFTPSGEPGEDFSVLFDLNEGTVEYAQLRSGSHTYDLEVTSLPTGWAVTGTFPNVAEAMLEVAVVDDVFNRATYVTTVSIGDPIEPEPVEPDIGGVIGGGIGGGGGGSTLKRQRDLTLHPPMALAKAIAYSPRVKIQNNLSWHDEREDEEMILAALAHYGMLNV